MARVAAGPKTKRGAMTVGGAIAIIFGWVVGDVLGYDMPDYVLQAWTVVIMTVLAEWRQDDENSNGSGSSSSVSGVREHQDTAG